MQRTTTVCSRRVIFALNIVLLGCGLPSESSLVRQFETVRPTLDTLRAMSDQDSTIVRVASEFVDPPSPTFTVARWNRYRELFDRLHSKAGLTRSREHVVSVTVGTKGLAVSGTSNGYIFFPMPPSPDMVRPTLEDTPAGFTRYRHLDGGWYLFLAR